jgi:hypothetical protein
VPYDWYSGSDETGEVPAGLDSYLQNFDDWSRDHRLTVLFGLLKIERDPNWRGHLNYLVGAEYVQANDPQTAMPYLEAAERSFDPLSPNFVDVASSFCRNRYCLIRKKLMDEERDDLILAYGLSVLCWRQPDTLTTYEERLLYNALGFALSGLSESKQTLELDQLAFEVRRRAIYVGDDLEDGLVNLFLSALALRDRSQCERILGRLRELGASLAVIRELETMMSNYLGDADATN